VGVNLSCYIFFPDQGCCDYGIISLVASLEIAVQWIVSVKARIIGYIVEQEVIVESDPGRDMLAVDKLKAETAKAVVVKKYG
jgi:hypothetical protein